MQTVSLQLQIQENEDKLEIQRFFSFVSMSLTVPYGLKLKK